MVINKPIELVGETISLTQSSELQGKNSASKRNQIQVNEQYVQKYNRLNFQADIKYVKDNIEQAFSMHSS